MKLAFLEKNPLRKLGEDNKYLLKDSEFGMVLAAAGVGKTAFLIQVALERLFEGKNVLHVTIDQPIKKVCLWYDEVFKNVCNVANIPNSLQVWDEILPHRFILTFSQGNFTAAHFEERVNDLIEQGIFFPQVILFDGITIEERFRETLSELKMFARENNFQCWFSARAENGGYVNNMPQSLSNISDMFELIIQLNYQKNDIQVKLLKGQSIDQIITMLLDPATLLVKDV